jgi:hypothetical protein
LKYHPERHPDASRDLPDHQLSATAANSPKQAPKLHPKVSHNFGKREILMNKNSTLLAFSRVWNSRQHRDQIVNDGLLVT